MFREAAKETSYIGEIGLDFSRNGKPTSDKQLQTFKFVLEVISGTQKFITIHSRGAEKTIFDTLNSYDVCPVIFHWYSGKMKLVEEILHYGHYLSVNTAMISSKSGKRIIERIPRERILLESDNPFVKIGNVPSKPSDLVRVQDFLTRNMNVENIAALLTENLKNYRSYVVTD